MIFVTNRITGAHYNIDDLNRVESNLQELSDLLNQYGYKNSVDTRSNWTYQDFFKSSDGIRYLNNLNEIIDVYYTIAPAPPTSMNKIDYIDANNIEKNLESINDLINKMVQLFKYSGTFSAGQDIIL